MDKEKIRKFARLVAVGTETPAIARDLEVSERTLRRWKQDSAFTEELHNISQLSSTEIAGLAMQLHATALRWAICYIYDQHAKDALKVQLVVKILGSKAPPSLSDHAKNENSEAFFEAMNLLDSVAELKRKSCE